MMRKVFLLLMPIALATPAAAQGWWRDEPVYRPGYRYQTAPYGNYRTPPGYSAPRYNNSWWDDDDDDDQPRRRPQRADADNGRLPPIMDGGPRPYIERIGPERIAFESRYAPGTIIIDTRGRQLLLQQAGGTALRYPISVGRIGFTWTGEEK
ncbi:MAG: hypothetical protein JSS20_10580, partial [Proteobacteria bacterium]|nr:hypothetical protein [Pseudomonadota bacterium]